MYRLRFSVLFALLGFVASCVTRTQSVGFLDAESGQDEDAMILSQGSLVVPLHGGGQAKGDAILGQYYGSVVGQMREAYLDRDQPALQALLDTHDRESVPASVRPQFQRFRELALTLALGEWLGSTSTIQLDPPLPDDGALPEDGDRVPLGATMRFRLTIGAAPVPERFAGLVLQGEGDAHAARLRAVLRVEDTDQRGDTGTYERELLVSLPRAHAFAQGTATLPMEIALPAGSSIMRKVGLEVHLMPGFARVADPEDDGAGALLPSPGGRLVSEQFELFPSRVSQVEERPLVVLATAMDRGDTRFHGHVLLAAHFMPEGDHDEAIRKLMGWVRLGTRDEPRVAMAALRRLTGKSHGAERQRWLMWFQDWERGQQRK